MWQKNGFTHVIHWNISDSVNVANDSIPPLGRLVNNSPLASWWQGAILPGCQWSWTQVDAIQKRHTILSRNHKGYGCRFHETEAPSKSRLLLELNHSISSQLWSVRFHSITQSTWLYNSHIHFFFFFFSTGEGRVRRGQRSLEKWHS